MVTMNTICNTYKKLAQLDLKSSKNYVRQLEELCCDQCINKLACQVNPNSKLMYDPIIPEKI